MESLRKLFRAPYVRTISALPAKATVKGPAKLFTVNNLTYLQESTLSYLPDVAASADKEGFLDFLGSMDTFKKMVYLE